MSKKGIQVFFSVLLLVILATSQMQPVLAKAPVAEPTAGDISAKVEGKLLNSLNEKGASDYMILMAEQADLSPAYKMDWEARGWFVYETLKATAERTQEGVIKILESRGLKYQSFIAGNEIYVYAGDLSSVNAIAGLDEVKFIRAPRTAYINPPTLFSDQVGPAVFAQPKATMDWGLTDTKAPDFWSAYNIQGGGIVVANIDTGVQWNHPALVGAFKCGSDPTNPACWADPSNVCGAGGACDNNGHGTHTMGTMVGSDDPALTYTVGMAPEAQWIACKGCESNSCSDTALNSCADWILAPGGSPSNRPHIVNNSWGGGGGDAWYLPKVNAWRAAGIFPAFSAGNSGSSCNTLGSPGDYQESFGTANHTQTRAASGTSSRGPSVYGHDPYTKPNLSAPGTSICSTVPTNSWNCGYSGTSMASPHVAGAVALLWSCNPGLIGQMNQTFELLQDTADTPQDGNCGAPPDGEGNYTFGYGYLNVLAAGLMACQTGTLNGTVSDGTKAPVADAVITADNGAGVVVHTTSALDGSYTMTLPEGTYTVTAEKYGYSADTSSGVVITEGLTTTVNFLLAPVAMVDVSGYVYEDGIAGGDAYGYPLYAAIHITANGLDTTIYSDPFNGYYSIELAENTAHTFVVDAVLNGYPNVTEVVTPVGDPYSHDFYLNINTTTCNAPGYSIDGLNQNFDSLTPIALPDGWTSQVVSGTDPDNYWSTYAGRRYPSGAAYSLPNVLLYRSYSINSGNSARLVLAGTYAIGAGSNSLTFQMYRDSGFASSNDRIQVQVSTDGGTTWNNVGPEFSRYGTLNNWELKTVDLSAYNGQTVRLAILGISAYGNDIHLDDLVLGTPACNKMGGGLVGGYVMDDNTATPLIGATVTGGVNPVQSFQLAGDLVNAGLYFSFSAVTGAVDFTASMPKYASDLQSVTVAADAITRQDFDLAAPQPYADPTAVVKNVEMGTTDTGEFLLGNTGAVDMTFEIIEKEARGKAADVLVVRHDTTAATAMETALTALGYTFEGVTDAAFLAMPVADLVDNYLVVFHAGSTGTAAGNANEAKLVQFLDAGGKLFIADNDLGYWTGSGTFYQNYLQATYGSDNGGDILVGEDIMAAFTTLDITPDPFPDWFTVRSEGTRIFYFQGGGNSGGVYVNRAGYEAIYVSFDFQNIVNAADEIAVIGVVMDTLGVTDIPWLDEDPTTGTVTAAGSQTIDLDFDATGFTQPATVRAELHVKNNSPYGKLVVPVTMNVTAPANYGHITGLVTGQQVCGAPGGPLAGAVVTISDTGGVVGTITIGADGLYDFWVPAGDYMVEVTATGYLGDDANVTVTAGMATVADFDLVLDAPCLGVDPTSLTVDLMLGQTTTRTLTVSNTGVAAGPFEIFEIPSAGKDVALETGSDTSKTKSTSGTSSFSAAGIEKSVIATPVSLPNDAVLLSVDDGSAEDSIGLTAGGQFIWFNRFSPPAAQFPFTLTQVQALFNNDVTIGDDMQVLIYWDDNTNPGDGATLLYHQTFDVTANDLTTWNMFTLTTPVVLSNPGDVLIGLVNRSGAAGITDYPAAIDTTASQVRSWIGTYAAGDPPTEPPLPADDLWGTIDSFGFAGNWTLRGVGATGGGDILWLSEDPVAGSVPVSGSTPVEVTFDATVVGQPGTYTGVLRFAWGYPAINVPVTMNVTIPSTWGTLQGTLTGLGACDAGPAVPLAGATVNILQGATLIASTTTIADGTWTWSLPAGTYDLEFVSTGYVTATVTGVVLGEGQTVTRDQVLHLAQPCLTPSLSSMVMTILPDHTANMFLTLVNTGYAAADWTLFEGGPIALLLELIQDGSFEAYTPNPYWDEYSAQYGTPLCTVADCGTGTGTGPRTGNVWSWFGGATTGDSGYVSQQITMPPGQTTITFWVEQYVCGTAGAANYMRLLVDTTEVWRTDGLDPACGVLGYRKIELDLSAFADGATHTIKFDSVTVGSGNFFVDDVSVDVAPDVPWLSEDVTSGSLTQGSSQLITVTFNSTGMSLGTHQASLVINYAMAKNGEILGNVRIPVTMHVVPEIKIFMPVISRP